MGLMWSCRQVDCSPSKTSDQNKIWRNGPMATSFRSIPRRVVLGGIAASGAILTLPGMAQAKMPIGQPQAPYFYRFKLGNAECTIVSDGQLPLGDPNAAFLNISKEEIARELHDNFLPADNAVLEQNVLVANFGDRVVLFDTGMGSDTLFGDGTGKLMTTLKQAGIDPKDVDAVVMSHAHIDHCGGCMADDGTRNFPNAQYYISQADYDYWTDAQKVGPDLKVFYETATKNLPPNKDRMVFIKDGQEFLPGIQAIG